MSIKIWFHTTEFDLVSSIISSAMYKRDEVVIIITIVWHFHTDKLTPL